MSVVVNLGAADDARPTEFENQESVSCYGRAWKNIKARAKTLKREVTALSYAYNDPRCPRAAKVVAAATILYAISPIDLIPDFIPVLGLLDDIILVPAGAALAIKLIPKEVMDEARRKAAEAEEKKLPKDWRVGAGVVGIWALGLGWTAWKVYNAWTSGGAEVAETVYNITQT